MSPVPDERSERKQYPPDIVIDPHERAARLIADRYALPASIANVIVDAAGLGGARQ